MRSRRLPVIPKVYLAGPIAGCSWDEAMDWRAYTRDWLENAYDVEVVNPLRCEEYLQGSKKLPSTNAEWAALSKPTSNAHAITVRSHWDAIRVDVVLANFKLAETVSLGSCFELAWAWSARVPCVVVLDKLHDHPFVRETAYVVVDSLDEAIESTLKLLNLA